MVKVAILTISDSAVAGSREDLSGPALRQRAEQLGWSVVTTAIVADDQEAIARQLKEWADGRVASLILTTGGTGVAARDVTPEATRSVLERELPGLSETMRSRGLEQTKFAILSRAVAGARKSALIVNLPGSSRGAVQSLSVIEGVVPHVIDLLEGRTTH